MNTIDFFFKDKDHKYTVLPTNLNRDISCPSPDRIVILFALYGSTFEKCLSANPFNYYKSKCHGKQSCTTNYHEDTGDDPCPGNYKEAYVIYHCGGMKNISFLSLFIIIQYKS